MLRDDDAIQIFVEESEEHLADIENKILALEQGNGEFDDDLINKVFRAVHTVKGGAGFLGYENLKNLAHKMEHILGLIRGHQLAPTPSITSILLKAADGLQDMLANLDDSNLVDISHHVHALTSILENGSDTEVKANPKATEEKPAKHSTNATTAAPCVSRTTRQNDTVRDQEAVEIFIQESEEHLAETEKLLLTLEQKGGDIDDSLVNTVFRAVHTVKGGAGFLGYENIKKIAHKMEHIMSMIRDHHLDPTPPIVSVLLKTTDCLRDMIQNPDSGNKKNTEDHLQALESIVDGDTDYQVDCAKSDVKQKAAPPVASLPIEEPDTKQNLAQPSPPAPQQVLAETIESANKGTPNQDKTSQSNSLRVNVHLLDRLMTLAGEMVLCRNQLVQAVASKNMESIEQVKQRIDITTSELQESVMFTRMQPIGNVFKRFPRLTRELSLDLGKEVELRVEGEDVEVDKTIIEAISAPLTHLIRNAIDHGIEMPEERRLANKDTKGKVILRAGHEAGMVILEVIDDGRGMSTANITASLVKKGLLAENQAQHLSEKEKLHLIFLPGFSTAESVTDISGRGVGMDVVKTNLDKLGGQIELSSKPGKGTAIRIKLPLTLAIISAQIIICGQQRYSIPQVNLEELLRVPPNEIKDRVELVGKAAVLKLRGKLLPLVKLVDVLGGANDYVDESTGDIKQDRRKNIADRRSLRTVLGQQPEEVDIGEKQTNKGTVVRTSKERRRRKSGTLYIAIVNTGTLEYGLVVDALKEAEEIVVKPLGRHLKASRKYSGATIMGDGCVSLILDVGNIAKQAGLLSFENSERSMQLSKELENSARQREDMQSFLLFRNGGPDQFAVPLNLVLRVIQIHASEIEYTIGKRVLQYRGESVPLYSLDEVVDIAPCGDREDFLVILFQVTGRHVGLLATQPVNSREIAISIDEKPQQEPGIMGSVIIDKKTTLLVNIHEVVKILSPHWFKPNNQMQVKGRHTILIAEDSAFFQTQVAKTLEEEGFKTIIAEDGQAAWEKLVENAEVVSLLVTDIEMPRLNGFKLTEKIRESDRFINLPIIALTTLAGNDDYQRGKEAGVNEYLVKFDRDLLIENVLKLLAVR